MTINELELLRADAEGKPDYMDEVICYSEALRNAAPALIAIVKKAKLAIPEMICTCTSIACARCELVDALKSLDEVKL